MAAALGYGPEVAAAQQGLPATVTRVVDGDTVDAQLADGSSVRVQLIGIDAPELGECASDQAIERLEGLVLGRNVTLVNDPTQGVTDGAGNSLFYVDRDDRLDVGLAMVRAGWVRVLAPEPEFQRQLGYEDEELEASLERGVWLECGGDFHRSAAEERRVSAQEFMRLYYRRVSTRRFRAAWEMLAPRVRDRLGPFRSWKAGHRRSLGTSVISASARLSSGRAVVSVRLRARDRDACSGRVVRQSYRGRWTLAPRRDSWVAVNVHMRKTSGGRVRLSKSECPAPKPRPAPAPAPNPPTNCQGYSPCLPPGADVDCAGGSGDGPRYVSGPVTVTGSDPYDLDRDGDGVACEA